MFWLSRWSIICETMICSTQERYSCKPAETAWQSDVPLDDKTRYREDYIKHPLQEKYYHEKEKFKPSTVPMESQTTFKNDYKDSQAFQSNEPFDDDTTHRIDYRKWQVEKPHVHAPEQYTKPLGEMEHVTSYKQEYTPKHTSPVKAIRHDGMPLAPGKFEGEPTYKADYRKWDLGVRPGPYGEKAAWHPPEAPFMDETTMKHDYTNHPMAARESFRPLENTLKSDVPFDDKTRYREDYIKHPLQEKYFHEKEQYKPSNAPMENETTFKRDYRGQQGDKSKSFKPDSQAFQSHEPFDDDTTHRIDYRKWPVEKPYARALSQYVKPVGLMDTMTTHKSSYTEKPIERIVARRPGTSSMTRSAPFDGITSYLTDYRKWGLGDRNKPLIRAEYVPNMAPFEGLSSYKMHYVPHELSKSHSYRPDGTAFKSDAHFDDLTMYRTDYTPKRIAQCEAAFLDKTNSRYIFIENDSRGHRLYQPVKTTPLAESPIKQTGMVLPPLVTVS
ncbi:hypothetical protein ACJMK2_043405 [Sinanodonta woodiana]|uniref:Stabilizer of axonemal microtubules 2 n=1 Tax=Sinanodonta woodiana TaxID=1069815 RepID=A0ABD3VWS7_SINWO